MPLPVVVQEILAQGNRIRVVCNGTLITDWRDPEPRRIKAGPIGLQVYCIIRPCAHRTTTMFTTWCAMLSTTRWEGSVTQPFQQPHASPMGLARITSDCDQSQRLPTNWPKSPRFCGEPQLHSNAVPQEVHFAGLELETFPDSTLKTLVPVVEPLLGACLDPGLLRKTRAAGDTGVPQT